VSGFRCQGYRKIRENDYFEKRTAEYGMSKDGIPYFDIRHLSGGGFIIRYSAFAFLEFLFSIKLAAFLAGGGAGT